MEEGGVGAFGFTAVVSGGAELARQKLEAKEVVEEEAEAAVEAAPAALVETALVEAALAEGLRLCP